MMNESFVKINSSFVSERLNKIRFIEEDQPELEPNNFITASSDNLKLWTLIKNDYADEIENEFIPKAIAKMELDGQGLTGLENIDRNHFALSSGGSVSIIIRIKKDNENSKLRELFKFKNLHTLCTGISIFDDSISTIGEDGKINVLSVNNQKVIAELNKTDSVTQTSIRFINYKELITGNRMGIMKSFDLRSGNKEPTATFAISCEDEKKCNAVTSLAHHPTQQHILLAGSEEGAITVYDLRQPTFPSSYLCAHDSAITELMFHPTQPDKLFTASANGELWKWTQNMMQSIPQDYDNRNSAESINSWLNGEKAKSKIAITTVLGGLRKSITSLDCSKKSRIICSCNNEAVYVIDNSF